MRALARGVCALVVFVCAPAAHALRPVLLTVEHTPGAESCASADALRTAAAARLAQQDVSGVFVPDADRELRVRFTRDAQAYSATVQLADRAGTVLGTRTLVDTHAACDELSARTALAMAIALDPLVAMQPPPPPAPPEPAAPPVPAVPALPPPEPEPPQPGPPAPAQPVTPVRVGPAPTTAWQWPTLTQAAPVTFNTPRRGSRVGAAVGYDTVVGLGVPSTTRITISTAWRGTPLRIADTTLPWSLETGLQVQDANGDFTSANRGSVPLSWTGVGATAAACGDVDQWLGGWPVALCATTDLIAVRASVDGTDVGIRPDIRVGLRARWEPLRIDKLSAALVLGAAAAPVRSEYRGPSGDAFVPSPVSAGVGLDMRYDFGL